MDRLLVMRVAVTIVGVAVWGYGYATGNGGVRMAGIIILAISLVLRFLIRRPSNDADATG